MSGRTGVPGGTADTDGGSGGYAGPGTEQSARHGPVTVTGYAPEDLAVARPGESGTGIPAGRTRFEGLADQRVVQGRIHARQSTFTPPVPFAVPFAPLPGCRHPGERR